MLGPEHARPVTGFVVEGGGHAEPIIFLLSSRCPPFSAPDLLLIVRVSSRRQSRTAAEKIGGINSRKIGELPALLSHLVATLHYGAYGSHTADCLFYKDMHTYTISLNTLSSLTVSRAGK